jgi:hypothetical protein
MLFVLISVMGLTEIDKARRYVTIIIRKFFCNRNSNVPYPYFETVMTLIVTVIIIRSIVLVIIIIQFNSVLMCQPNSTLTNYNASAKI